MRIRKAQILDAESIHKLAWQLGYAPAPEAVKMNVERMIEHRDYDLVVAVDESANVVGWMSLAIRLRIEDGAFLQVAALVTDQNVRGQGVGRFLMEYAIQFARDKKLPFVGLYSSKPRTDAHAFYEHIGYQKAKESFFFRKDVR